MNKQRDGYAVFADNKLFSIVENSRKAWETALKLSHTKNSVQVLSLDNKEKVFIFKSGIINNKANR